MISGDLAYQLCLNWLRANPCKEPHEKHYFEKFGGGPNIKLYWRCVYCGKEIEAKEAMHLADFERQSPDLVSVQLRNEFDRLRL